MTKVRSTFQRARGDAGQQVLGSVEGEWRAMAGREGALIADRTRAKEFKWSSSRPLGHSVSALPADRPRASPLRPLLLRRHRAVQAVARASLIQSSRFFPTPAFLHPRCLSPIAKLEHTDRPVIALSHRFCLPWCRQSSLPASLMWLHTQSESVPVFARCILSIPHSIAAEYSAVPCDLLLWYWAQTSRARWPALSEYLYTNKSRISQEGWQ
ncbi:hypothetical protein C8Q73DRAFT_421064 [Cubamyces lactineus]|nr:hypothetical protein C8Q73DRAFT_421064 [Cubamyces lactineus]